MNPLQLASLVLALACTSHVSGGLLPPSVENQGYQYNRPNEVGFRADDLSRRGYEPIGGFAGFGAYDSRSRSGFRGRPTDLYGAPGLVNYPASGITEAYAYQTGPSKYQGYNNFDKPQPYSFQYEVRDPPSGNDYGQRESSDGNLVRGEYRVLLPDSRTQIVRYTADDSNGYIADVRYEGQAQFQSSYRTNFGSGSYQPGRATDYGGAGSITGILDVGARNQYLPPVATAYSK